MVPGEGANLASMALLRRRSAIRSRMQSFRSLIKQELLQPLDVAPSRHTRRKRRNSAVDDW
jgi:hypothetical protein